MKRSTIHDRHVQLGARFQVGSGWEVPSDYGDPLAEHRAVREAAGAVDLPHRTKLLLDGRDALDLLHRIASADVKGIAAGGGGRTFFLSDRGKVLAEAVIYRPEDRVLLDAAAGLREKLLALLDRSIIADDVRVADETETRGLIALHGPATRDVLSRLSPDWVLPGKLHDTRRVAWLGAEILLSRAGYTGEDGVQIYHPVGMTGDVWGRLLEAGVRPIGGKALETLRLEAGQARYGVDVTEETLAPEAPSDDAISYSKGCYVGQEVVARVKHIGHLNRALVGIEIEGGAVPERRATIRTGGREVGFVTSATRSPSLGRVIALGYVAREFAAPGSPLTVALSGGEGSSTARVAGLPFYRRP